MSFTSVYDANSIEIDGYFDANESVSIFGTYDDMLNINGVLSRHPTIGMRVGPIRTREGKFQMKGKMVLMGLYLPKEQVDPSKLQEDRNLRSSLQRLEKVLTV